MNTARPVLMLKLYYHGGIAAVRTLGRLGVPVYAIHDDARAPAARSRYLREVLEWDFDAAPSAKSLEFVLETGRRIGRAPVLIAADDTAQAFVSEHANALHQVFEFPRQPAGLTERLYSKRGLHELCLEHGVPTPVTFFPRSRDEAREAIERSTFPLVLKPIDVVRFKRRNDLPSVRGPRRPGRSACAVPRPNWADRPLRRPGRRARLVGGELRHRGGR